MTDTCKQTRSASAWLRCLAQRSPQWQTNSWCWCVSVSGISLVLVKMTSIKVCSPQRRWTKPDASQNKIIVTLSHSFCPTVITRIVVTSNLSVHTEHESGAWHDTVNHKTANQISSLSLISRTQRTILDGMLFMAFLVEFDGFVI